MVHEKHKGQEAWLKCLPSKQGPEFKPHYCQKEKGKKEPKSQRGSVKPAQTHTMTVAELINSWQHGPSAHC